MPIGSIALVAILLLERIGELKMTKHRAIRVPDDLWAEMKELAELQETSVTQLLIRLMREELER